MSNSLRYFQQERLHNHHEKSIPVMTHSHGTEFFSYIQMELFLSNLFALCTSYTNHHWSTWKLWLDCPQPSLPKAEKIQFLQPFFLQPTKWFGCLLLNPLWFLNVSMELREQRWDTVFRCGLTRALYLIICSVGSCWCSPRHSLPSLYQGCQFHTRSDGGGEGQSWCGSSKKGTETFMGAYLGVADNWVKRKKHT